MEHTKKHNKIREKKTDELNEQDDLDSFIEKRKIQNDALKKIMGIDLEPVAKKKKKREK